MASNVVLDGVELLADRIEHVPVGIYRKVYKGVLADVLGEAGPYDVLLMGELIEHVPFAALDDLIEQSTRLLAHGGRLLMTTPNPHYAMLRRRSLRYRAWRSPRQCPLSSRLEAVPGMERVGG